MSNEITPTNPASLSYGNDVTGFEHSKQSDTLVGRLFTPGGTSKYVQGEKATATAGDILISIDNSVFIKKGQEALFVPIGIFPQYIEWDHKQTGKYNANIIAQSLDPNSSLARRAEAFEKTTDKEGKEVLAVTQYRNIFAIFPDKSEVGLVSISMAKSNFAVYRSFFTKAKSLRTVDGSQLPLFGGVWSLRTKFVTKRGNNFYIFDPTHVGNVSSQDDINRFRNMAKELHEGYSRMRVDISNTQDSEAEEAHVVSSSSEEVPF